MANHYKFWTVEEKLNIITPVLETKISIKQQARNYGISDGMLANWIKAYKEKGYEGLVNKRKPGNPLVKYSNRKELTDIEKLEYENMKLRIENERLKKGYFVEGDGTVLISTRLNKKNSK